MTDRPKLPRVRPEDLEEGRWYVVKYFGGNGAFDLAKKIGYLKVPEDDWPYMEEEFDGVWGPIPEFELEGE